MEKIVITGRKFEQILEKSGFTKADFAQYLSKELSIKRTRQWVSQLILRNPHTEIPARWVNALKEMVGKEEFERWAKSVKGLNDTLADSPKLTQSEARRIGEEAKREFMKGVTPERLKRLQSLPYEG